MELEDKGLRQRLLAASEEGQHTTDDEEGGLRGRRRRPPPLLPTKREPASRDPSSAKTRAGGPGPAGSQVQEALPQRPRRVARARQRVLPRGER